VQGLLWLQPAHHGGFLLTNGQASDMRQLTPSYASASATVFPQTAAAAGAARCWTAAAKAAVGMRNVIPNGSNVCPGAELLTAGSLRHISCSNPSSRKKLQLSCICPQGCISKVLAVSLVLEPGGDRRCYAS
jgi:hypothetical protein